MLEVWRQIIYLTNLQLRTHLFIGGFFLFPPRGPQAEHLIFSLGCRGIEMLQIGLDLVLTRDGIGAIIESY